MAIGRTNAGGGSTNGMPEFTYTGTYTILDDGDKNWRIKFLTSGTFTPARTISVDIFCVGGGGYGLWGGGGGGYTTTVSGVVIEKDVGYEAVVGAGSSSELSSGGQTSFSACIAAGGNSTSGIIGASGGSGGGGRQGGSTGYGGDGGSDGSNGTSGTANNQYTGTGGLGQGTTTREFGEATGDLYGGGGGGAGTWDHGLGGAGGGGGRDTATLSGAPNTGGGNGGYSSAHGLSGGSGIVVIRNHRAA